MNIQEKITKTINEKQDILIDLSNRVWEANEIRFDTPVSAQAFKDILLNEGFNLESAVGNMEHSFVATYGSGEPTIAMFAEYDALPGFNQNAFALKEEANVIGGNGHGCGHNLLGTGTLAGAVAVKELIQNGDISGTIKLVGCPAEEALSGKGFFY
ncbi:M20/M25/M40 family metallo-hydrolase [Lactococcus sp. DD01]|uniref:M20/M25/M40 family metallo-hydrolase n=1 Tax=Lactococcus sp. DD01 TaxID=1776443 RepID=UPI000776A2AB|nr:M20/M25/M40 family metallo-hydrolase [Lactococcus sp. DD01]KXT59466.1 N-acyl-L-amino acid amidohydrolase [Lactococcus sp. DD01]